MTWQSLAAVILLRQIKLAQLAFSVHYNIVIYLLTYLFTSDLNIKM